LAAKPESGVKRLIRFLALGVPTVSRILALALVIAATGIAFFDLGDYTSPDDRANVAAILAGLALVSLAIGFAVPAIIRRILPNR
jgi:hypothetical protein